MSRRLIFASVFLVVLGVAAVVYQTLDLREPRRTRSLLTRMGGGDPSAWDEFKMDPPRSGRAIPALLEGLGSTHAVVRERAIVGACGLPLDPRIGASLARLKSDTDAHVRGAADHCLANAYSEFR
jgi:hypothetical protein